jgi:molybdopterin converting factor small subunit
LTITVKVDFVGVLRKLAGKRVSLEFSETVSVKGVLRRLLDCYAPVLEEALIDPELKDPRPNVIILVNKQEISVLDGLETNVGDGDRLVLIPVSHGG